MPEEVAAACTAASKATALSQQNKTQNNAGGEKRKRINWSTSDVMKDAVEEWDRVKGTEGALKMKEFAITKSIPYNTFQKYVHSDPSKRRKVGTSCGVKSIVPLETSEFLIQTTIRADRANEGLTRKDQAEYLQDLQPQLTRPQAFNFVCRTLKRKSRGRLKPRPVMAQKTTSKRSQCTVAQ